MPAPPVTIHKKLKAASCQMNCPVPTATKAKRKMIREEVGGGGGGCLTCLRGASAGADSGGRGLSRLEEGGGPCAAHRRVKRTVDRAQKLTLLARVCSVWTTEMLRIAKAASQ